MFGWQELMLIVVIVLLIFGARRIPEIARALGKASREFKGARDEFVAEAKKSIEENPKKSEDKSDQSGKNV